MRAWRRGDAERTLHLLTRGDAKLAEVVLAARAALALGRPDAAYAWLGRATGPLVELARADAAEAQGQLDLATAHARRAGWRAGLRLARLARLTGREQEARRRLDALRDRPAVRLERALLTGDARRLCVVRGRLAGDARWLALALTVEPRRLIARSLPLHLAPAFATLATGEGERAALERSRRTHRRAGRRDAFDLFSLALADEAPMRARVARDGSWLEVDGARVSLRRRPRVRRALAALVSHPRGLAAEALFDRVWEEPRPTEAILRNRVDVTLARLRATGLGERVERRRGLVRLVSVEVGERMAS